jgi:hypothetical protein
MVASVLVRGGERAAFRAHWHESLYQHERFGRERGVTNLRTGLRAHAMQAFGRAATARWGEAGMAGAAGRWTRSARFAMGMAVGMFLLGFVVSGGFRPWRIAHRPLPVDEPQRLVTLSPIQAAISPNAGLSPYQFFLLRKHSEKFLDRAEAFAPRWTKVVLPGGEGTRWMSIGVSTEGLLPLLGYSFAPGAVLGHEFGSRHPELLGRRITILEQSYLVTGILPPNIRISPHRPDVWITMGEGALSRRKFAMVLVGRVAPGLSAAQADREFQAIAEQYRPFLQQSLEPLRHGLAVLVEPVMGMLVLLLVAVAGRCLWRALRVSKNWRFEWFFFARTALLLGGLAGVVMAQLARYGSFYTIFFVVWIGFVAAAMAVLWSWRDHGVRCRKCLARMTYPVRIGTHANSLLEGVGSELICENGHGTLWMPGTGAQAFGPEVWRAA